jgi:hypothetical protein
MTRCGPLGWTYTFLNRRHSTTVQLPPLVIEPRQERPRRTRKPVLAPKPVEDTATWTRNEVRSGAK